MGRHDARKGVEALQQGVTAVLLGSWWFPETDAGVVVQVVVTLLIGVVLGVAVRKERSLVLLVTGVTMVTIGWYGIRGLH